MRCIYQAENLIDAHLVLHQLEDAGIAAQVLGDYLTGGLGELPVMGLVRVVVADDDAERAAAVLVQSVDSSQDELIPTALGQPSRA